MQFNYVLLESAVLERIFCLFACQTEKLVL